MPLTSTGYVYERMPDHPIATKNGTVLQHRRVWFDANGAIPNGFVIHHINGDKTDNRLENLELCDRSSHMKEHYPNGFCSEPWNKGKTVYEERTCANCGTVYMKSQKEIKQSARKGHRDICSLNCLAAFMRKHRARREQ